MLAIACMSLVSGLVAVARRGPMDGPTPSRLLDEASALSKSDVCCKGDACAKMESLELCTLMGDPLLKLLAVPQRLGTAPLCWLLLLRVLLPGASFGTSSTTTGRNCMEQAWRQYWQTQRTEAAHMALSTAKV